MHEFVVIDLLFCLLLLESLLHRIKNGAYLELICSAFYDEYKNINSENLLQGQAAHL